ncbi:MAG: DUF1559 family PulG-like putative transporter, partial [Planctomycetota bacterium]
MRSDEAIGQILTCPKCGSLVEVAPPAGWKPSRSAPEGEASQEPPQRKGGSKGRQSQAKAAAASAALSPGLKAEAPKRVEPPDLPPPAVPTAADPPVAAEGASTPAADAWEMPPVEVAPTELLWRKWVLWAAAPLAGLVIVVSAWGILSSRETPEPPSPPVGSPEEPVPVAETPEPEEQPEPEPPLLDRRWLPDDTRVLIGLPVSQLAVRGELALATSWADSPWEDVAGKMLGAFGLKAETVRRLSWAATDLAAWPDPGVIVIGLEEGQDAGVFRVSGERIDLELAGNRCRRLANADWPHPFAILDDRTILTGREELLRTLADRKRLQLESPAIDRLLEAAGPDVEAMALIDLAAARQLGWRMPDWCMDVWPAGKEAWHVVWTVPQGLGLWVRRGPGIVSEIGLQCEGETAAESVRAALDRLIPAARSGLKELAEGVGAPGIDAAQGEVPLAVASEYKLLLNRALAALQSTRCNVTLNAVWVQTDWGSDVSALVGAVMASRPAVRAEWLAAALVADRENHGRLIEGLSGYRKAKGHFPAGARGGVLLAPETRLSWISTMLPYYGHEDWHRELDFQYSWNGRHSRNPRVAERPLETVINPALGPSRTEAGYPVTHYVGVAGFGPDAATLKPGHPRAGVFGYDRTMRLEDIADGASNTIAITGVTRD